MNPLLIGGIVETVGRVADDLFTSDEERARAKIDEYKAETERMTGQIEVNKIEAANNSTWRPLIGKVCAWAMAYHFIIQPLLVWIWALIQAAGIIDRSMPPPPPIDPEPLWVLITGMLGLGTARAVEKIKGRA